MIRIFFAFPEERQKVKSPYGEVGVLKHIKSNREINKILDINKINIFSPRSGIVFHHFLPESDEK